MMDIETSQLNIGVILLIMARLFLTGIAMSAINQVNVSMKPRLMFSLKKAYRRYFRLAGAWIIITFIAASAVKIAVYACMLSNSGSALPAVEYLFVAIAIAPFMFALPAIIIENRKVYQSFGRSFSIFSRNSLTAALLALLLSAAFVPIPYLTYKLHGLGLQIALENSAYLVAMTFATTALASLRKESKTTQVEEALTYEN